MSDHGGLFLDYLIENHMYYMGLPMALSRNRYINELSVINRYINSISNGKLVKQLLNVKSQQDSRVCEQSFFRFISMEIRWQYATE